MSAMRIVTRRARDNGVRLAPGDLFDTAVTAGRGFGDLTVVCTLEDIGDPGFRGWLYADVASRVEPGGRLVLDLSVGRS